MANGESGLIVVGIGASAGGLESLKEFFGAIDSNSGLAFVVIQHLAPSRESWMADILAKYTEMMVREATNNMPVESNCVYTIPPNKFLRIEQGRLFLCESERSDGMRMPIDYFFRSLADDQRERAVCVLLSGSGSDGTLGLREVRAAGGLTIVQKPETAQFDMMLRNAIATGMVDFVLPLREIAEVIHRYVPQVRSETVSDDRQKLEHLDAILDLLTMRSGSDFTAYKKATLLRRTERRMGINRFGTLIEYLRFLQGNPVEIDELAKDMLIGVSSFFRDPEAFEELRRSAIIPLVGERADHRPIHVWIPACSTGEEAYSIAMLFLEELVAANKNSPLQIFASDVDSEALKFAREGIYPHSIAADLSEARLSRFFTKQDSHYQVSKRLRESVIFSLQNLLTDAPFSRLDLISCRNLLIYIEPVVQRRLISLFAFALTNGGYLFLGKSDGIASQSPYFAPVSAKWRVYRRSTASPPGIPEFSYARGGRIWGIDTLPKPNIGTYGRFSELSQETLLKHFNASVVLVDEHGTILYFFGATSKYLEHPTGEANTNLLNMVDTRLAAKLRMALRKVVEENQAVDLGRVEMLRGEIRLPAKITVTPVPVRAKAEHLCSIVFEEAPEEQNSLPSRSVVHPGEDDSLVAQLESELKSLKAEFQSTINEYETSAEELKAANEEILSINEELQSTNEELETSKEEIQSVNEELNTVNGELNSKIEELSGVNNDLLNFVNSSEVATVFLDSELKIKRFTPAASAILNVIGSDVGRPIAHLTHEFNGHDLVIEAKRVLDTLIPLKQEIRASNGRWYSMTCLPYRTMDNKIDGVILTFIEVTPLKQSEISMREARNFSAGIIDTVNESLLVLDDELRVVSGNRAFYEGFGLKPTDVQSHSIFEIGNGQLDLPELRQALEKIVRNNDEIKDLEIERDLPRGRRRLLLNAKPIARELSQSHLILLAIADITERNRLRELIASEEQMRQHSRALEQQLIASGRLVSLGEITASMAHEFNNPLGVIMGFVEDLLEEADPSSPQYEALRIVDEETKRCEKIIQDLMQFARPGDAQRRQTYLHAVIDTTLHMMESRLYKQKVTLARRIQPDLPPIEADPQQIEQVLVNLYLNAVDAMPDGGTLTIGAAIEGNPRQQGIAITVTDTGRGMNSDEVKKIFQPFYTANKKAGLGLGLPICERIVKNHGGRIEIESEPGKGTTFKIILPLTAPAASS
ncbi:MAG TPA: chemotaxis protein CheB [Candidatus Binatia bacterium]